VERESRKRMSRVRRTIAARMIESWNEVPRATMFQEIDATPLIAKRAALRDSLGKPVSVEAVLLRVLVPLLREFPQFNACADGEDIITYNVYDIGIAVDTPVGVMLPVVKGVDRMGVGDLDDEIARLVEGAADRTLLPAEMEGATFSISNLGSLGGGHASPILPLHTSAFLSIGRAKSTLVLDQDQRPVEVPMMPVDTTVDHRVVDGAPILRFIIRLAEELERATVEELEDPLVRQSPA
jgi:pyruvate dehydrogenase E2 component (dihydrolipoamide acetyltransferase)